MTSDSFVVNLLFRVKETTDGKGGKRTTREQNILAETAADIFREMQRKRAKGHPALLPGPGASSPLTASRPATDTHHTPPRRHMCGCHFAFPPPLPHTPCHRLISISSPSTTARSPATARPPAASRAHSSDPESSPRPRSGWLSSELRAEQQRGSERGRPG